MIYMNIYSANDYAKHTDCSIDDLPAMLGVESLAEGDCVASLCGGKIALLPKAVADDLRNKTGYAG